MPAANGRNTMNLTTRTTQAAAAPAIVECEHCGTHGGTRSEHMLDQETTLVDLVADVASTDPVLIIHDRMVAELTQRYRKYRKHWDADPDIWQDLARLMEQWSRYGFTMSEPTLPA